MFEFLSQTQKLCFVLFVYINYLQELCLAPRVLDILVVAKAGRNWSMASYRPFPPPPQSTFATPPNQNPIPPLPPPPQSRGGGSQYTQNWAVGGYSGSGGDAAPSLSQNYNNNNQMHPGYAAPSRNQIPRPPLAPPHHQQQQQQQYPYPPPLPPADSSYPPPPPPSSISKLPSAPMYYPSSQFSQFSHHPPLQPLQPPPPPPPSSPPPNSSIPPPPPPPSPPPPPLSIPAAIQSKESKPAADRMAPGYSGQGALTKQIMPSFPSVPPRKIETEEERRLRKKRELERQRQEEKLRMQLKQSQGKVLQKTQMLSSGIKGHGSISGSHMGEKRTNTLLSGERTENRLKKPTTFLCKLR